MSKRLKQKGKNVEDIPSDVWIYKIFRFLEVSKVFNVFTLLSKRFRELALKSLENRLEKDFRFLYFSTEEEENLNISEHDILVILKTNTFDLSEVGMNIAAFLVQRGYKNALKELFSILCSEKDKYCTETDWNNGTWIRCVHNELFEESGDDDDIDFEYFSEEEEEEEEEEVRSQEEEEEETDFHSVERIAPLTSDIFHSEIDFDHDNNENCRFYKLRFTQKLMEYNILDLSLKHNDLDLIKFASQCFGFFWIPEGEEQYEWDLMDRCGTRILKCLEQNNDEFACYFVKKYDKYISFEYQYIFILQEAIHSNCKKCCDLILSPKKLHSITSNFEACDCTYMTDLYFNAFFFGKRYGKCGNSTVQKMIHGTLDESDEGGCKYSDEILKKFLLSDKYCKKGNEFCFPSEQEFEEYISNRYRMPVHGRIKNEEYEDIIESSDEEQHEINKEYQHPAFFEKEEEKDENQRMIHMIETKDLLKVMRKAGVMAVSGLVWEESRCVLQKFLKDVISLALENAKLRRQSKEEEEEEEEAAGVVSERDVKDAIENYVKKSSIFVGNKIRQQMKKKVNDMKYLEDLIE